MDVLKLMEIARADRCIQIDRVIDGELREEVILLREGLKRYEDESKYKSVQKNIRLTPQENEELKKRSEKENMTESTYIRKKIFD